MLRHDCSAEYTKEGAPLAYGKNRSAPSEEEENSSACSLSSVGSQSTWLELPMVA